MERRDINIMLVITDELPDTIGGISEDLGDNSFQVAINGNKSEDEQARAFLHECLHIWHGDHTRKDVTASELEHERHEEMKRFFMVEAMKTE